MFMNDTLDGMGFQDSIHYDLLDISEAALAGYALKTAIGPIFEDSPSAYNQFVSVSRTLWNMTLSSIGRVTFTATTNPVPEPSTIALLGLGLVGIAGVARKKISA
jgi:PEP-CTERM motif